MTLEAKGKKNRKTKEIPHSKEQNPPPNIQKQVQMH
jgi:hypothetical protein